MSRKSENFLRLALACFALSLGISNYSTPGSFSSSLLSLPIIRDFEKYLYFVFIFLPLLPKSKIQKFLSLALCFTLIFDTTFRFSQYSPLSNLLSPLTSIMRIVFPLYATGLLSIKNNSLLLLIACFFTFLGHGLEAIFGLGKFIDYILYVNQIIGVGAELTENEAKIALRIIGALDILSSFLLLSRYKKIGLKFMVLWGLMTAVMRLLYYDFSMFGVSEFFLRIPHWIIPLMLLAYSDDK